jgi:predicted transcriptional regulator YdeE
MQHLNQFTIAGISITTTNANNQAQNDIHDLWQRFFKEGIASKIPNKQSNKIYAVYTDYEGDFTKPYKVIIGYAILDTKTIAKDLTTKIIPASNYKVFNVSGKYPECLTKAWQDIWHANLNRKYLADFEVYPEDFNFDDAKLDIYISIKS